jgi:hypothetical protein
MTIQMTAIAQLFIVEIIEAEEFDALMVIATTQGAE